MDVVRVGFKRGEGCIVRSLTWRSLQRGACGCRRVSHGVSTMVMVCGGALTLVGALYDGGNSFEVEVGLRRGRGWVHFCV